jgi:osmotically-inducible protein OsmY
MARSCMVLFTISIGLVGCARGSTQPTIQSSESMASLRRAEAPAGSSAGEITTLAEAPRHAQDSRNATVGEYVLPATQQPSASKPQAHETDPDFSKFDAVKRNLEGTTEPSRPSSQGTSELDRKLTASIRKAMLTDPRLSYNAKAISIETRDGHVTLRGVVNNSKERAALAEIAARTVGLDKVDSEVKVK